MRVDSTRRGREEIDRSADPGAVTRVFERLAQTAPGGLERVRGDDAARAGLIAVSAASPWLARVCVNDPQALDVLSDLERPVEPQSYLEEGDLPRLKQLEVLRIAARDLLGIDDVAAVGIRLAELAQRLLEGAYGRSRASGRGAVLAVIGMGKLGAGELNYSSDVDIILVSPDSPAEPSTTGDGRDPGRAFVEIARRAWRVDLDLRPEGRSGPLMRSLGSYRAYWQRWAETWEFQALIKARPVAGEPALGRSFAGAAADQVWRRPYGPGEISEVRRAKARAEGEIAKRGLTDRELKRGPGGIRDVEFAIQLLQLVHGHADPAVRAPSTLAAIEALATGGYIAPADAAALADAYRFLRKVEHYLQLFEGQQVHTLPPSPRRMAHLARVIGFRDGPASTAVGDFDRELRRHRATARSIHERLFFRPLLEIFSTGSPRPGTGLSPDAASTRLAAFGFTDAERTRQAVADLTKGFSRKSKLMQQMLPVLLDWLSRSPDPDQGLLGLRTLSSEHHARDRLTELCRESPVAARQLCELLGTGPRLARDLLRHPDAISSLASGALLRAATRSELDERVIRSLGWRSGEDAGQLGLRLFMQTERLRIAVRDILGLADVDETGAALADLAEAVIAAAVRQIRPAVPFAVVGMGRLCGREMGYGSDLDLLLVHDVPPGMDQAEAAATAEASAVAFTRLVGGGSPATGAYRVDLALRPEGRQGPATRSIEAYAAYYERWARPWERQALLRGRLVAGDPGLGERFGDLARSFVWDRPFGAEEVVEIRRTKARVERERVPAGEDPKFHLKLGPGSLSDIEWTAQLLQLQHRVESPGTVPAILALEQTGALSGQDAAVLVGCYRFCERTRNRLNLIREVPGDALPSPGRQLTTLARSLMTSPSELRNEYARHTRRTRRVVERLFYGR